MPYKDIAKRREYNRQWVRNRRAEFFKDKKCVVCGSIDRLELDHINRTEKVSHRIWSWSLERRKTETDKCQILCHEHHLEKTAKDMNYGLKHGTATGYIRYKCRCRLCTDAVVKHSNEYRWRTGRRKKREK